MHRTPLYDWHVAHGGRMVEFGGWEMPVQYTSIVEEHHAVRNSAGLFDISHMGRLWFSGKDVVQYLNYWLTLDVDVLKVGQIRYSLVCNSTGGIRDDVLVYRLPDEFLVVVNAGNRHKFLAPGCDGESELTFDGDSVQTDHTQSKGMLAVQGPMAVEILKKLALPSISTLKYYHVLQTHVLGGWAVISRTGYTGEDGFEIIIPNNRLIELADAIVEIGQPFGLKPCGLGARDTLRLEAAMPLYGHELTEDIDPFTAGLDFAVKLDKPDFIGKQALAEIAAKPGRRKRIGLQLEGKRIAREGCGIFQQDQPVGIVTSGTFSPTTDRSIAMAYIAPESANPGTSVEVEIRGKREQANVVSLPFYRRPRPA